MCGRQGTGQGQRSLGQPRSQSTHPSQGDRRERISKPSEAEVTEGDSGGQASAVKGPVGVTSK